MSAQFKVTHFGQGASILQSRGDEALSLDAIRANVPAVFASAAHASRSDRFVPVPTAELLDGLAREGFRPFYVAQAGAGDSDRHGYTKHMLRLRHATTPAVRPEFGRIVPEVIITNANDGTAAYSITLGLFRFVCLNGLMVGQQYASARVAHGGRAQRVIDDVIEGTYSVVKDAPAIVDATAALHAITMPEAARLAFANDALALRWRDDAAPITPERALQARRPSDAGADIWSTFNVLQENILQGGAPYMRQGIGLRPQRRHVRPLRGIGDGSRINRALWDEAQGWRETLAA